MPTLIMRSRFALAFLLAVVCATIAQAQVRDTVTRQQSSTEQTYFEFQVDKPVRHAPGSAAPRYPPELKAAGVEGEVLAQFVVDTFGLALVQTFRVLKSTHGEFTASVKTALPGMKFVPAELRGRKVRQLVQQPFVFAIQKKDSTAASAGVLRAISQPPAMLVASITPAPRTGAVRGWTIVGRLTADSGTGSAPASFLMRRFGTAGRTRVEMEAPARLPMGSTVTLTDSSTGRTTVLMPSRKSANVIKTQGRVNAPFSAKFRPSAHGITDLGAGETIAGLPTRHYRVKGTTEWRFDLGTQVCALTQETITEYWATTDPTFVSIQRQARGLGTAMLGSSSLPLPDADSSDLSRLGSFLRVVAHNAAPMPNSNGAVTVTSEVVSFSDSTLDASLFDVPEGYQVRDLSSVVPLARSDSLRATMTKRMFEQWVDTTKVVPGVTTRCTAVKAP
ncbi:MAG: energy transducer TonB [Gemmatimonadaceae bacterium]|nr:energy transducer TonB [Gemmatimonadaceae bacterium]